MSSILGTIGIDISKDWLDVFAAPEGRASRFPNGPAGLCKLIAWIGPEVDRIAYEPTGQLFPSSGVIGVLCVPHFSNHLRR